MGIGFFIDGAYLSICWRKIAQEQLDFAKLLSTVETLAGDKIFEAYCFDATTSGSTNDYFKAMQRASIRVKLYEYVYEDVFDEHHLPIIDPNTRRQARRRIQKGVDVGLATHLLDSHRRRAWDKLVLTAGDADFAEPIRHLVEHHGVELTILGLPEKTSHAILPYATRRLDLRELTPVVARRPSGSASIARPILLHGDRLSS